MSLAPVAVLEGKLVRLRPAVDDDIPELVRIRLTPEVHARWRGGDDMVAAVHEDFDEDPDDVDTDPTGIPLLDDGRSGRHAASDAHDDDAEVTEAVPIPRIASGQLAIHLPMDDPYQVPDGYPVKANASFGLYYMPDSALYEDTMAEIWFASEEIAQANGFHRAG